MRAYLVVSLALLLTACESPLTTGPAPCASGSVLTHANTVCSLGAVTVSWPAADSLYNPATDCKVSGAGPVCPSQAELKLNPDPNGGGTILVAAQPNAFALNCQANCSLAVTIHYGVSGATQAGPRLNAVGGAGSFEVIGTQTVAGSSGTASCNGQACGGASNAAGCQTSPPYCVVMGSAASHASTRQQATATLTVDCQGGHGCTTALGTFGLHHL